MGEFLGIFKHTPQKKIHFSKMGAPITMKRVLNGSSINYLSPDIFFKVSITLRYLFDFLKLKSWKFIIPAEDIF